MFEYYMPFIEHEPCTFETHGAITQDTPNTILDFVPRFYMDMEVDRMRRDTDDARDQSNNLGQYSTTVLHHDHDSRSMCVDTSASPCAVPGVHDVGVPPTPLDRHTHACISHASAGNAGCLPPMAPQISKQCAGHGLDVQSIVANLQQWAQFKRYAPGQSHACYWPQESCCRTHGEAMDYELAGFFMGDAHASQWSDGAVYQSWQSLEPCSLLDISEDACVLLADHWFHAWNAVYATIQCLPFSKLTPVDAKTPSSSHLCYKDVFRTHPHLFRRQAIYAATARLHEWAYDTHALVSNAYHSQHDTACTHGHDFVIAVEFTSRVAVHLATTLQRRILDELATHVLHHLAESHASFVHAYMGCDTHTLSNGVLTRAFTLRTWLHMILYQTHDRNPDVRPKSRDSDLHTSASSDSCTASSWYEPKQRGRLAHDIAYEHALSWAREFDRTTPCVKMPLEFFFGDDHVALNVLVQSPVSPFESTLFDAPSPHCQDTQAQPVRHGIVIMPMLFQDWMRLERRRMTTCANPCTLLELLLCTTLMQSYCLQSQYAAEELRIRSAIPSHDCPHVYDTPCNVFANMASFNTVMQQQMHEMHVPSDAMALALAMMIRHEPNTRVTAKTVARMIRDRPQDWSVEPCSNTMFKLHSFASSPSNALSVYSQNMDPRFGAGLIFATYVPTLGRAHNRAAYNNALEDRGMTEDGHDNSRSPSGPDDYVHPWKRLTECCAYFGAWCDNHHGVFESYLRRHSTTAYAPMSKIWNTAALRAAFRLYQIDHTSTPPSSTSIPSCQSVFCGFALRDILYNHEQRVAVDDALLHLEHADAHPSAPRRTTFHNDGVWRITTPNTRDQMMHTGNVPHYQWYMWTCANAVPRHVYHGETHPYMNHRGVCTQQPMSQSSLSMWEQWHSEGNLVPWMAIRHFLHDTAMPQPCNSTLPSTASQPWVAALVRHVGATHSVPLSVWRHSVPHWIELLTRLDVRFYASQSNVRIVRVGPLDTDAFLQACHAWRQNTSNERRVTVQCYDANVHRVEACIAASRSWRAHDHVWSSLAHYGAELLETHQEFLCNQPELRAALCEGLVHAHLSSARASAPLHQTLLQFHPMDTTDHSLVAQDPSWSIEWIVDDLDHASAEHTRNTSAHKSCASDAPHIVVVHFDDPTDTSTLLSHYQQQYDDAEYHGPGARESHQHIDMTDISVDGIVTCVASVQTPGRLNRGTFTRDTLDAILNYRDPPVCAWGSRNLSPSSASTMTQLLRCIPIHGRDDGHVSPNQARHRDAAAQVEQMYHKATSESCTLDERHSNASSLWLVHHVFATLWNAWHMLTLAHANTGVTEPRIMICEVPHFAHTSASGVRVQQAPEHYTCVMKPVMDFITHFLPYASPYTAIATDARARNAACAHCLDTMHMWQYMPPGPCRHCTLSTQCDTCFATHTRNRLAHLGEFSTQHPLLFAYIILRFPHWSYCT